MFIGHSFPYPRFSWRRGLGVMAWLVWLLGFEAAALPNLTGFLPTGWSSTLVVTVRPGSRVDSTRITLLDEVFVSFCIGNQGPSQSTGHLVVHLYLDGARAGAWATDLPVNAGSQLIVEDYSLGHLSPGSHQFRLSIDPGGLVAETNEADNVLERVVEVGGQPNLLPVADEGMSSPLVVSTTRDTRTDASVITSEDTLFLDMSVGNAGEMDTDSAFYIGFYVDGVLWKFWSIDEVLPAGGVLTLSDEAVGPLPAGEHDLVLVADVLDEIWEEDESDNSFARRIFVRGAPNLLPHVPADWPEVVVVSSEPGTRGNSTRLGTGETLYVDWAVGNIGGGGDVTNSFLVHVWVDDVLRGTWTLDPPLAPGAHAWRDDLAIGPFEAGTHTIRVRVDASSLVAETNETDNEVVRVITVANQPNLAPVTPDGWSGPIVVDFDYDRTRDAGVLLSTDLLYVDLAVMNRGREGISVPWEFRLLLDGKLKRSWTVTPPFQAGRTNRVLDYSLGSLDAGSHTLQLVVDSTNAIAESSDADNSYSKTFEVLEDDPFGLADIHVEPVQLDLTVAFSEAPAAPAPSASPPPPPMAEAVTGPNRSGGVRRWDRTPRGMRASPEPFLETQSDGTSIPLRQRGGFRRYWWEDEDGFTVVREGGALVYAARHWTGELAATPLRVGRDDPRAAGLRPHEKPPRLDLAPGKSVALQGLSAVSEASVMTAPLGTVENVVILARFSNHATRDLPAPEDYDRIFNAEGGDPVLAPTGSVRDFYRENSYGQMTLRSTVFGWVTLPNTESYYAGGVSGRGVKVREAIRDALVAADPLIDSSRFDANRDGYVDAITFIHSGYGGEASGTSSDGASQADRIWSHRWVIPTWTSAEGVRVSNYHINPGLWGISGNAPTRIGVLCHETGHFFGLPDLYDADGFGEGAGSYDLMANGWGFTNDQRNPPHFSAWSKIFLGWVTPTIISGPGTFVAPQVETSPTVFRLNLGYPAGEYLLIENREPVGFESILPQGGLAIWHVDDAKENNDDEGYPGQWEWPENDSHYGVALLQADGRYDLERYDGNRGDAGDLFHAGGVHEIGTTTVPNTDSYRYGIIGISGNRIHEIGAAGTNLSFRVSVESATNRFRIGNSGDGVLRVESITWPGTASWLSVSPPPPYAIRLGEALWVTVTADPGLVPIGTNLVRLQITSNDFDESPIPGGVQVRLIRAPPAPVISITPGFLEFGPLLVGTVEEKIFLLRNTGGGTLGGEATVSLPFQVVAGTPYNLVSGQSQVVVVRYAPTVAGTTNLDMSFTGGGGVTRTVTGTATNVLPARVTGRYVFYNQSAWDGGDPAANARDDAAIAGDKSPLLPGGTARFSNYTSYNRGINGIMVDVVGLRGAPTPVDFAFSHGNSNDPLAWSGGPAPAGVFVRAGAGSEGGDRVTVIWGAEAVKGRWLSVRLRANAVTGLAADEVFFFGNAVGEAGNQPDTNAIVNATDEVLARVNSRGPFHPAPIDFPYDFNRDKQVNATDQILARGNTTSAFTALRLIRLGPAGVIEAPPAPAPMPASLADSPAILPGSGGTRLVVRRLAEDRLLLFGSGFGPADRGTDRTWSLEFLVEGRGWEPAEGVVELGGEGSATWVVDPTTWQGARWFRLRLRTGH